MPERVRVNPGEEKVRAKEVWPALSNGFSELRKTSPFIHSLLTKIGERVESFEFQGFLGPEEEEISGDTTEFLLVPKSRESGGIVEAIFVAFDEKDPLEIAWILFDPANLTYTYANLYDYGSSEHPGPRLELQQYFLVSDPGSREIKDLVGKSEGDLFDATLETFDSKELTVYCSGETEFCERANDWQPVEGIALEDAIAKFTPNEITRGGLQSIPSEDLEPKPSLLETEWQRQVRRLIELGFHTELGLSEQDYLDSLPHFNPQSEQFKGRFDIPVIVETRIPVKRQCELAGVGYFLEGLEAKDWQEDPRKYKTPNNPYTTWMQDGKKNLNRAVEDVRMSFAEDERGATEFDGIALYIAHPEILNDYCINLPGTQVEPLDAACLEMWSDGPKLNSYHVDGSLPGFGSASCGRV